MGRHAVHRFAFVLALASLVAHCATRPPALTPRQRDDLTRADNLVQRGCYRCLREAYDIYTGLASDDLRRVAPQATRGAFDVGLLLSVREKELGLAADQSLARARALLGEVAHASAPGGMPTQDDLQALVRAAEAVVGELSGLDAEERQQRDDGPRRADTVRDDISRLQDGVGERTVTGLTAAYLGLALDCEQPRRLRAADAEAMSRLFSDVPLVQYRLAICTGGPPGPLARLREADPRWTDTYFFEGKYALGSPARPAEPERAAALLRPASASFPASVAIRMTLARAQEMNGAYAEALANFDGVVVRRPAHADARLGRVRTLSYLGRADEGIAAATTIIDAGAWHVGDAYYWRAWNAYQLRRLEPAWADVQHALRLQANTAVYALAGSIAWARADLETSVQHFDSAFAMDHSNCLAVWSAGLVQVDRTAWQEAAERFSTATDCFGLAASRARAELAALTESTLEPDQKATRLSSARKRAESAETLGAQSALNAAQNFVNSGLAPRALPYLALAERHPDTREKARALRARLSP